ncbi:MAG TPA: branched-chain amino acid ABC transporter permease [archaeon]|jgi:branched-chain amino acid transport system permease protein|nr:branched-chain amino acid ABC transporter permease [archaeon]HPV66500.1 branched-chain amino acid ABC transporter permease [archaeon]HRS42746.1 branched-chain amino acid ABC transporter permease [Candidatus Diapherotrites archaeon]
MILEYLIYLVIIVAIQIILCLSLQVALGYTGLFNFGHIAFFAIGAYTSALLTVNGVPFLIAFILSAIIPSIFAFLLSIPTNKLKGDYLALSTMAFSFLVYAVLVNWITLTRGPFGIYGIPKPNLFGLVLNTNFQFLIFTLVILVLSYLAIKRIVESKFGKVLEATRDDEPLAQALGKNTFKIKTIALMISAFFAGIAGSLYAHFITFIDPSSFTFVALIPVISILMIGGLASLKGTIIATIILTLIPETLRFVGLPSSIVGPGRQILFALLLLVILIYFPKGFFGKIKLE